MKLYIRRYLYIVVLTAGIALSAFAAWQMHQVKVEKHRELFSRIVRRNITLIEDDLANHINALNMVGNYFLSSNIVELKEFEIFVHPLLQKAGQHEAMGWITYVPISQEDSESSLKITHISPRQEYPGLAGFEIKQNADLDKMIFEATKSRKASLFFVELPILQRPNHENGKYILSIFPAYSSEQSNLPFGYSFSTINVKGMMDKIVSTVGVPFSSISIESISQNGSKNLLTETKVKGVEGTPYEQVTEIDFGGQKLVLTFLPTTHFLDQNNEIEIYALFAVLCLLTVLLSLYLREMDSHMTTLKAAQEKAEEANRLKNDFLATMSHEIRSPMSGVLGMAELLLESKLSSEQRAYTKTIINSGESLLNIIEDILDFSKIEADKLEITPMPVNMLDLMDDTCILYAPKAREQAVEIAVRYVPGTEQFVYADPVRMRQIVGNLVNNAIKFTNKGYVIITVKEDKIEKLPDGRICLVISVEDTGIGISEEAQKRIFEKFTQADASTTREFGGTGLGLSICKRLVEMMDGTINVSSIPGKGSIFTVRLALTRNREEVFVTPKSPILRDLRILIVDDLDIIRTMVSEQLTLAGLRCNTAQNGEEALEMMMQASKINDPYKIVLIDYLMPNMNGEVLARAISDENILRDACLIMLTAAGNPITADVFARKGFSAYISKPVRTKVLVETLAVVWEQYRKGRKDVLIRVDSQNFALEHDLIEIIELQNRHVLLAEDSRVNQAFAEDVLTQMGCFVTIVSDGQQAVQALLKEKFDLVLMDCQMPVMDGFEAARRISVLKKQGQIPAHVPVIALTANAMKGDRDKCIEAGMDDYLAKPVRTKDLRDKVYHWLKNEEKNINVSDNKDIVEDVLENNSDLPIIDHTALAQAKTILKDKYPNILTCYIQDVESYLAEIENACANDDVQAALRPAHTIKSSSQRMGAMKLSEAAKELEFAVNHSASIADVKDRLSAIKDIYEETRQSFYSSS